MYNLRTTIEDLESRYDQGIVTALDSIGTNIGTTDPTFEELINGIVHSQDINTGTIADNLSVGKEAWVNGEKIVGNGKDNEYYYNLGYMDAKAETPNASISYVYHKHDGTSSTGGACYAPIYHSHTMDCYGGNNNCKNATQISAGQYRCNCDGGRFSGTNAWHMCWDESHLECDKGGTIIGYSLICGKTEQTIESATIVFN